MKKIKIELTFWEVAKVYRLLNKKVHRIGPGQYAYDNSLILHNNPIAAWLFRF